MIAVSSSGKNFRALARYLAAGRSGQERDRVAWSVGRHLPTDDPELGATIMRATAAQSTRVEKPVYHLTISFDPTDAIDRGTMEAVAVRVLERLGLAEHQAVLVAHRDRAHPHVHLMVNRIHPVTGRARERWQDQPLIQQVLRAEEQARGLTAVPGRLASIPGQAVPDRSDRTSGERRQAGRTGEPALVDRIRRGLDDYRAAGSWRELEALLAEDGFRLARKGQGLVIIDGVHQAKASRVARDLAFRQLERKFGVAYADRQQEPPVSGRVARVSRDLRRRDRRQGADTVAYQTRLSASAARSRLAQLERARQRFTDTSAALTAGFRAVYRDPTEAQGTYQRWAAQTAAGDLDRSFLDAPERFGPLRTRGRLWRVGWRTAPSDAAAREAARALPDLAQAVRRARRALPTAEALAHAVQDVREAERRHRLARAAQQLLPTVAALESTLARHAAALAPHEVQHLSRLVTAPHVTLALTLRRATREIVLGRTEHER
jgi:hypothetical protein